MGLCFPALACAPVSPPGIPVHIEREEAIIIWDAAAKTQHFIRRASFDTNAKDFGFLVPTPTQPQLAESSDAAFGQAADLTKPAVVFVEVKCERQAKATPKAAPVAAAPPPPVTVLAEQKVAGYDAAILEATDADALNEWLKAHGYVSSPELAAWFAPYIANRWKITAFKISGEGSSRVSPQAVRMSFKTGQPYFPYREPESEAAGKSERLLRVFFLSSERVAGTLGAEAAWHAKTVWSNPIADADRDGLLKLIKMDGVSVPQNAWLTEFEDRASPRPGKEELFFQRSADQSTMKRPDNVIQRCVYVSDPSAVSGDDSSWFGFAVLALILAGLASIGYLLVRKSK